jgi:hypothetical protein
MIRCNVIVPFEVKQKFPPNFQMLLLVLHLPGVFLSGEPPDKNLFCSLSINPLILWIVSWPETGFTGIGSGFASSSDGTV